MSPHYRFLNLQPVFNILHDIERQTSIPFQLSVFCCDFCLSTKFNSSVMGPRKRKGSSSDLDELKKPKNETATDYSATRFESDAKSQNGKTWNIKFSSWNVNGIRAWLKKGGIQYLEKEDPDVFCLQETKCHEKELPMDELSVPAYHTYWSSAETKGYSGTGLYSKKKPLKVSYGIGIPEHDKEGRCITAEYEKFYLVCTYVPNAGRGLVRLDYRMKWDRDLRSYLKGLDAKKPVVWCGDLNVAHKEIDIKNPKSNVKNAGFTKEERDSFSECLSLGFVDTFRFLHPSTKDAYTFWSFMGNARAKNVGWRLDYFVVSARLESSLCDSLIRSKVMGSDHCPVVLLLHL